MQQVFKFVEATNLVPGRTMFPAHLSRLLDEFARQEIAPEYATEPEVLSSMRQALEEVVQDGLESTAPRWTRAKYLAYLMAFAPLHAHKLGLMLREVLKGHRLTGGGGEFIRVLDVGAGPGLSALSLLSFFELVANAYDLANIMGDEKKVFLILNPLDKNEDALDLYQKVVYSYVPQVPHFGYDLGAKLQLTLNEDTRVPDLLGQEQYDLIVFSHVLSELKDMGLDRKAQMVLDFSRHLSDHGCLLYLESPPQGGIAVANQLKGRIVSKGLELYGPCAHIMGKPTGPICLTCGLSQREEVFGVDLFRRFLRQLEGPRFDDLARDNRWVWGVFRKDGSSHHPDLAPFRDGLATLKDLATARASRRATVMVQIARREDRPFPFYKVCDQSTRIEDCYLTFEGPGGFRSLAVGEILRLADVLVDSRTRDGAEGFKNRIYLTVDAQTRIENVTGNARALSTVNLW